jgi:type IV fimbrial biogenesis protein FimT
MRGISADFTLAMQRARSEAINRNECVAICMSSNSTTCASTGSNWGGGWIAFRSPTCEVVTPANTDIFLVQQAANARYQLSSVGTVRRSVIFRPRGNAGSTGAKFNLVDTRVSSNDTINRTFCLDFSGRITTLGYASSCS